MSWFSFWLTLHILAAIVAFGPTLTFPVLEALGERDPRHLGFAVRVSGIIARRIVLPFAATMPVSGVALIVDLHVDLLHTTWLLVAIGLYVVLMGLASGHQLPTVRRMAELAPAEGAAPSAEFHALAMRVRVVGMLLYLLIATMVVLMIWAPGGIEITR